MISRRKILEFALVSPIAAALPRLAQSQDLQSSLLNASSSVVPLVEGADVSKVKVGRRWKGAVCQSQLVNQGSEPVKIKEVVLFDVQLSLPATSRLYGEGFQMLSQTGGTLGQPIDLGNYTDAKHYKLPAPGSAKAFYGMMMLSTSPRDNHLLAFTSCSRFIGQFYLSNPSLKIVVDTEGGELRPGETWQLERFTYQAGSDREQLLANLADQLVANHPPLRFPKPPTGWCSWYCFGSRVTAKQVLDNLDFIDKRAQGLRYVQIDDGYQPTMGDWLETGPAFGGNVRGVLKEIRERGFEPAIWVAPFVAEEKLVRKRFRRKCFALGSSDLRWLAAWPMVRS
jgi:alpha-galactosidase